jgi:hypothetical protein
MERVGNDKTNGFDSEYIRQNKESENPDKDEEDISSTSTEEEDNKDDDDDSFKIWLKNVSECLQGFRKVDPDKMQEAAEEEMEEESDEERCMRIVRSVLDEETALEMVKTYLRFTKVT